MQTLYIEKHQVLVAKNLTERSVWNLRRNMGYYKHFFNDEATRKQRWSRPLGKGFVKRWNHDNPDEMKDINRVLKKAFLPPGNPSVSSAPIPEPAVTQNQKE